MKILITGITGLFGSYLAKEFFEEGEIHGLKRPKSNTDQLGALAEKIIWHNGDINDFQSLEEAFEGMDLIIHSAGLVSFDNKDRESLLKVNHEGTTNVVNVMLDQGIKKIIHVSSVAAIGRDPEQRLIGEDHKWVDSPWNTPYSISKYYSELEVWRGVQEGLEAIVLNPSILLAKMNERSSSTGLYEYVQKENSFYPLGDINYIDVRDAAKISLELFQKGHWGERFILNNKSTTYQMFFKEMAAVMEKKAPNIPIKDSMIPLASLLSKIAGLFGKKGIVNKQTSRLAQQQIRFDNTKIKSVLNPQFSELKETFKWALNEK
ncbi:SDR family NAD(P)-dependent oxidoreductase [Echinicola marina]|uniref:SDR family NAD(P)-dependent oxidoreductase n=1 Tax=Echinicola marina TaxID=2859768 RepID=UPI001CF625A3|nr:SDR family NAD(P)-dependent oxidoreductase [Echinicola marina]UCS94442.1 SDR family NAD(P)-dependent oxidoreductase [Echinicola marina]